MSNEERAASEGAGGGAAASGFEDVDRSTGPIAWMTKNSVAANLLMLVLVAGGVGASCNVKQEVFPEFDLDVVTVGVAYPGASPAEVEQGVILAIEEGVRSLDGIKRVTSTAVEGSAAVLVELELGADRSTMLQDVSSAVDQITTFPEEAEEPVVSLLSNRKQVIQLVIYGDASEEVMRQLAEKARQGLLLSNTITYVELGGVREREIAIEIPQANLRKYNLTLDQVAQSISSLAIELPGGGIKTRGGEILLRTNERRDLGAEFEDLVVVSTPDGSAVTVAQIATINDGFEDNDQLSTFNGQRAVMVNVFRSGDQTPVEIAAAVREYAEKLKGELPPGISATTLNDRSIMYQDRVDLLLRNGAYGLLLVLIILGLFLDARLSFWVTLGIPISFMGSIMLMPAFDVSLNMISLFAFIITLGIVVDDAIVVGENIYEMRQRGMGALEAAVRGAKMISVPVVFSVLTTVAAFMPMFLVPGASGKFFRVLPLIVICVLFMSLIESLFILPAHLSHGNRRGLLSGIIDVIEAPGRRFSEWLKGFIDGPYGSSLRIALANRLLTLAVALGILFVTFGYLASGRLNFSFLPKVETDFVAAKASLPFGVAIEETERVQARLVAAAQEVLAETKEEDISLGMYTQIGAQLETDMGPSIQIGVGGGTHLANAQMFFVPSDQRETTTTAFAERWRDKVSDIVGLESLTFSYATGPSSGSAIEVQLIHDNLERLEAAAAELAAKLQDYAGVKDIDDGFSGGKPQLSFRLTPEGRSLGLTALEVGRQVRASFYGAEALRQQRGRDEVKVMVRLPKEERESRFAIESLLIRLPEGGEIPLGRVAAVEEGTSYTDIRRADGRRKVSVTADVVQGVANPNKILAALTADVLPELVDRYPGLSYTFEGNRARSDESLAALQSGFLLALFVIYALLAIPFKSYIQPLVVMSAIPFGVVGAVGGHLLMGYELSLISVFGIVAVSGIVVNDSLVLVHAANERRREGYPPLQAIQWAGKRRFRPILLTSLTTFFGLMPMILETSVQARFLIPMAISLAFGVLFSTFIILLLVPSLYLLVEDVDRIVRRVYRWLVYGESDDRGQTGGMGPKTAPDVS